MRRSLPSFLRPFPLLALSLLCSPAAAQYRRPDVVSLDPGLTRMDNVVAPDTLVMTSPVRTVIKAPLIAAYTGVVNVRRGRLELYYFNSTASRDLLVAEVSIPPGATAAVLRPGSTELWIALPHGRTAPAGSNPPQDGVVVVVDGMSGAISHTIPVGKGPSAIAFLPDGSHAWVSCSVDREVDLVDASQKAVVRRVPVDQFTPHAVAVLPSLDLVLVSSRLSGNNTTSRGDFDGDPVPDHVVDLAAVQPPPTGALRDHDVVALTYDPNVPANVAEDPTRTATGLMTVQYNMTADPVLPRVYVVGTEALNADFIGERNFVAGRVVENRLAILDYGRSGPPTTTLVDLDAQPHAPMATPTDFVVSPADPGRGFLIARGVDRLVEFDLSVNPPISVAAYDIVSGTPGYAPSLVGARLGAFDPGGTQLAIWCEIENSFAVLDLTNPPTDGKLRTRTTLTADPLPEVAKRGWAIVSDANRSASRTSSCFSCHVDGGSDNIVWDLSKWHDPEGTPESALTHEQDHKGPMLTQLLFGLAETAPYHWRGEQRTLREFAGTFPDLLEGPELSTAEIEDMVAFLELPSHPPNPYLALERDYAATPSPNGLGDVGRGFQDFENFRVYGPSNPGSCGTCHQLPTGTNNELIALGHRPSPAVQVTQLRSLFTRIWDPVDLGSWFGAQRMANGAGLLHNAGVDGLDTFQQGFRGLADPSQQGRRNDITAFVEALDGGLAPATCYVHTLPGFTPFSTLFAEIQFIIDQTRDGHADFSVSFAVTDAVSGTTTPYTAFWDRTRNHFVLPQNDGLPLLKEHAQALLDQGIPLTFIGHPPGTGHRWSIDADDDQLLDRDEILVHHTDPTDSDSDGDGFPDGYEVQHNTNPLVPELQSNDHTAPQIVGGIRTMFTTTNTVKLELNTDEPARVTAVGLAFGSAPPWAADCFPLEGLVASPRQGFTTNHQLVLNGLPDAVELLPVQGMSIDLEVRDPAGNLSTASVPVDMGGRAAEPIRVQSIQIANVTGGPNGAPVVQFDVSILAGTGECGYVPPGFSNSSWDVKTLVSYGTLPPGTSQIQNLVRLTPTPLVATADASNLFTATFTLPLPPGASTDPNRVLAISIDDVEKVSSPNGYTYIESQAFKRHHAVLSF